MPRIARAVLLASLPFVVASPALAGQAGDEVTFNRDIAPILQRSCQSCHRPGSMAPMSLVTYEEVRPWARSIRHRTGLRDRTGVMPPWFIEKDVGIQRFKDDPSLSEDEIATIARWVDSGAPRGNPADLPPALDFGDGWDIGAPDLVVRTPSVTMPAVAPDRWGALDPVPLGLTEDRYVSAMQVKEFSNVSGGVGGRFIFHHALMTMLDTEGNSSGMLGWPNTTSGRFGWRFDPEVGRFVAAGSRLLYH